MKAPVFTGVCTSLVTPFAGDHINYPMLDRLIDRQFSAGVNAVAVCGTAGEATALSIEERLEIIRHTAEYVNGRCTVIAGTGANNTLEAIRLARGAQERGANALLIATPYCNTTTQPGLIRHYAAIAESIRLPIIVCNAPSETGMSITPETYLQLSRIENINGVKEDSGDVSLTSRIRNLCRDELNVWSGRDESAVAMMALGAQGFVSTTSNLVPGKIVRMCGACLRGNYQKAGDMQNALMPLIDAISCEVSPMPVKAALRMAGYDAGPCRAPLCELTQAHHDLLENLLPKVHIK